MKKIFVMIAACLFACVSTNAQTWAEWFEQKKTQKEYLQQQIAALQVYISYARKGYTIANKGISTIRNIKKGDFHLHRDFFSSLQNVNPKISSYAKIADIITCQARILKKTRQTIQDIKKTKQFTSSELDYCKQVFDHLLEECIKTIEELVMVISSGKMEPDCYQMTDDERLKRIDRIYSDIQDKYSFCSSFSDEMGLLSVQRMGEQIEIKHSKLINGIK